jgi:hypothetical protein
MKASSQATPPSSAAGVPNAMQVFQNAAAGQLANDGPLTGSGIDDVMDAYPPLPDMTMADNTADPAANDYPLAIQGLLGGGVSAQPYADALSQPSFDAASPQPDPGPSVADGITAPDMRDPASDDYPLAIQGLLGNGVSAQPYTDALSRLSFDATSPQPNPSPSVADGITAPDMRDPASGDYPLAIQGLLGDGVSAQPYADAVGQLSLDPKSQPADFHMVRPGETLWSITHGDYAEMAAVAQRNGLKLAADGSPIVRPGDLLLIPKTSGSDPAAIGYGRNMIAANTQLRAQQRAAQVAAQAATQKADLELLDRIHPPMSMPANSRPGPDFSSGQLFTPPAGGDPWAPVNPWADLRPKPPGQDYYIDSHGQRYALSEGADGSEITPDNRGQDDWQRKWDEIRRVDGYGPDEQPGMGSFASIGYGYSKLFGASDDVANRWGALGSFADDVGGGLLEGTPYGAKPTAELEEGQWTRPPGWRLPVTKGHWADEPGDSDWISANPTVNAVTGNKPIPFRHGYPDFSQWAQGTYKFDDLTGDDSDFQKVYDRVAKDQGLPNRTAAQQWLSARHLTPHHVPDGATIELIPWDLHKYVPHLGGAFGLRYGGWK